MNTGAVFSFIAWVLICLSCSHSSPVVHYYTLNPATKSPGKKISGQQISIVVGPVLLADYLNRPHMVTRSSEYRVQVHESHRWAGSLTGEIMAALSQNLAALLPETRITTFSKINSAAGAAESYQIIVNINQFDGLPGHFSRLIAEWKIKDVQNKKIITMKTTDTKAPAPSPTFDALAASMSKTLDTLSRQIALELASHSQLNLLIAD